MGSFCGILHAMVNFGNFGMLEAKLRMSGFELFVRGGNAAIDSTEAPMNTGIRLDHLVPPASFHATTIQACSLFGRCVYGKGHFPEGSFSDERVDEWWGGALYYEP